MLRSIRWTLQLWHAGLLAVVLAVFGGVTFLDIRRARFARIDADVERSVQLIAAGVRPPPRPPGERRDNGPPDFGGRPFQFQLSPALQGRFDGSGDAYYVIWDRERRVIARSAAAPDVPAPPPADDRPLDPPRPDVSARFDGRPPAPQPPTIRSRGDVREAVIVGPFGSVAVAGRFVATDDAELRRLGVLMLGTGVGVLAVGLAGGLLLAARVTRPIRAIGDAAEAIGAANLSRRIDLADTDSELGRLGRILNDAFDRLETAVRQQVRFTADASHELRTPLAVMHASLQLALSRDRSVEEYKKALATCHRASTRMKDLVDSLLLLAGVDAGRLALDRGPVDLGPLARDTAELIAPLAAERGVAVTVDAAPAVADGDATRLGQVLTNLLSNAVRYNTPGGRVHVSTGRDGDTAVLTVADTGVGIPPEHRSHLFERFYRVDVARSRAEGGSGLGLAIVRGIVLAHGGTISFDSPPSGGTVFTVRLPGVRPTSLTREPSARDAEP